MPIRYKIDILKELNEKGLSTYRLRDKKILSPSTIKCLKEGKPISFDTLAKICELLNLQPSDIIEYVPDIENLMKVKPEFTQTLLNHAAEYFQEDKESAEKYQLWYQNKYSNSVDKSTAE